MRPSRQLAVLAGIFVLLEIAPGVTARYAKAAIGKVNTKAVSDDALDDEAATETVEDESPAPGTTPKSLD